MSYQRRHHMRVFTTGKYYIQYPIEHLFALAQHVGKLSITPLLAAIIFLYALLLKDPIREWRAATVSCWSSLSVCQSKCMPSAGSRWMTLEIAFVEVAQNATALPWRLPRLARDHGGGRRRSDPLSRSDI